MVTRGQRRLGRTIRKLGDSVELSVKESKAKELERRHLEKVRSQRKLTDSPVQSLKEILNRKDRFENPT
jgi:hypothetical protein